MKARVDPDICIGCGLCANTCPEVFDMQGDKAVVKVSTVPDGAQDTCKKATEECPVTAIFLS